MTEQEALDAVDAIMEDHSFGDAGARVVIEEFMEGEEASLLAFTDGTTIRPMISAQDHKRAYDGDRGPNTGGMGTYAPAPVMTPEMTERAVEEILKPTIAAMAKEGRTYRGCLYLGLMVTADGPKVVEFNARFGDPETQVVLPLLDSDLVAIMCACADGTLADVPIRGDWRTRLPCRNSDERWETRHQWRTRARRGWARRGYILRRRCGLCCCCEDFLQRCLLSQGYCASRT